MANDLATLSSKLATALRDTDHETWNSTEKDDLVTWAVANLWGGSPRIFRELDPTTTTVSLVADTYFYPVPSGVVDVWALDLYNGTDEYGMVDGSAWQLVGDPYSGLKIRVSPALAETGYTLRVHGIGRYDVTTNLIPDDFVPLVLAIARAEAYRRITGDRARFEQWLASNQTQNMSVNELLNLIDDAEKFALRERRSVRTWAHPVPGRQGA